MKLIAPSLLSCDFGRLTEEIHKVSNAGADLLHIDIMDGHFVPNITIGPDAVRSIRKATQLPLDVHLMISEPVKFIEQFALAGADMISIHVEACDLEKLLPMIRKFKCKAGAVLNPPTPLDKILPYVEYADYVLVMTVNPGFGGQQMIPECIEKIRGLRSFVDQRKLKKLIEVDGGVKLDNIQQVASAGADIIIAGSAIFEGADYARTIAKMREAANRG